MSVSATDSLVIVQGQVSHSLTNEPLESVSIQLQGTTWGTTSDHQGKFSLTLPDSVLQRKRPTLLFTHLGFVPKKVPLSKRKRKKLNIALDPQTFLIEEFTISGKPTLVYGNANYQLIDYEIQNGKLALIGFEKRPSRSTLLLVDNQKLLATHQIPGAPIKMLKDCRDDVYIVTRYAFLKMVHQNADLRLPNVAQDNLNRLMNSCVDRSGSHYYFEFYTNRQFAKRYYHLDSLWNTTTLIHEIEDAQTIAMANDESAFLYESFQTRDGRNNSRSLEFDRRFGQMAMLKPLVAPLKILKDTVYIFNHLNNQIDAFSEFGVPYYSVPINYHEQGKWSKEIIKDPVLEEVYTHHQHHGYTIISRINTQNGETEEVLRTDYRYVEKIQIYDGEVYFLYRPTGSLDRKALYKQRL